jgi:hypothetical protein
MTYCNLAICSSQNALTQQIWIQIIMYCQIQCCDYLWPFDYSSKNCHISCHTDFPAGAGWKHLNSLADQKKPPELQHNFSCGTLTHSTRVNRNNCCRYASIQYIKTFNMFCWYYISQGGSINVCALSGRRIREGRNLFWLVLLLAVK